MTWYGQRLRVRIHSLLIAGVVSVASMVIATGAASASTASSFTAVTPTRILDTRSGSGPVGPGGTLGVQVAGVGGVPSSGVAAVVVNLTVTTPSSNGWVAAYPDQAPLPTVSNLNFTTGQTNANLAIVPVGSNGRIDLHNGSPGTVQLLADVSGYFLSGASFSQGAFSPLTPTRVLDTRRGLGAPQAQVVSGATVALQIAGAGGIPASGVSAVVVNLTVTNPAAFGYASAYPSLTRPPNVSTLNFSAGETIPNLAVVPVGSDGKIDLTNYSGGHIDLLADVFGYFTGSSPSSTGAFAPVTPARVLDTRSGNGAIRAQVPTHGSIAVKVAGTANVPASGVSAVVANLTVTQTATGGWLAGYPDETTLPNVSNLNFAAGETRPNLAILPVGADGRITLYNGSFGTVQIVLDVSGYFLGSAASVTSTAAPPPPLISTSRYLRKLTGASTDARMMAGYGSTDAAANPSGHPYLMLLDIGGQDAVDGGVILSATSQFISYPQLVSAVNNYVDGYVAGRKTDAPATIVVGTNNDIDVSSTTGADWATKVIAPIAQHAASYNGITIGGADDMEPGFSATAAATRSWLSGYLKATKLPFVFNGSADGCSWTAAGSACNHGWTAADLQWLAGGAAPSQILSLPQIYNQTMAQQWKYISLTGVSAALAPVAFAGALTEYTACQQAGGCGSLTGNQAWNAFWSQLQSDSRVTQADLPYSTDLLIS